MTAAQSSYLLEPGRGPATASVTTTEPRDWRVDAACAGADPELFFGLTAKEVETAKLICQSCPVRTACRQWADEHGVAYGVWGAESEDERRSRLAGAAHASGRSLAICEHCRRAYLRRRSSQQFCSHRCHHASMTKLRGRDCGTTAAARRHRKRGEPMDDACRLAESLYRAQLRSRLRMPEGRR